MISVVIPVYNGEQFIPNIISDLNNQTFKDFEVVFINDGSKDNTSHVIQRLIGQFDFEIKLLNQINKGVSAARNRGLREAKGDYIAFVDVDDGLEREFLERLHYLIIENDSDVSICTSYTVKSKDRKKVVKIFNNKQILYQNLGGKLKIGVWGTLISKRLIDNNKLFFPEDYKYSEDLYFMWKTLAFSSRVVWTSEELYNYKIVSNSAMSKFNVNRIDGIKLYQELSIFFKFHKPDFYKVFTKKEIPRMYWSIAWQAAIHLEYNLFKIFIYENKVISNVKKLIFSKELKVSLTSLMLVLSKRLFYFSINTFKRKTR